MSSRARVVAKRTDVSRFDWGPSEVNGAAVEVAPEPPIRQAPAVAAPEHAVPELTASEQQARLAAIERDAFAKGYAQGERAGVEAGAKRAEGMLRRVAQTLDELSRLRGTIIRDTEKELVQLALTLARRIVLREVTLDPTLVAAMAHVALERLGESTPATIRLHPEDYTVIASERGEAWEGSQVTILPDPAVARGGCLVTSDFGMVDASLDAQFDEMARALLGEVPGAPPAAQGHAV